MPFYGTLSRPYQPRHTDKRGRPSIHTYTHAIAYTETMRGIDDDIPTMLFIGAPWRLLQDVCTDLCKMMRGKLQDITLRYEHSCRVRNGKNYWRIAVGILGLDEGFISLREFESLIVAKMQRTANCTVKYYKTEPFLNL